MVFEIYSHPETKRYKARACSAAMFFQVFMGVFLIVLPFVIAYKTYGFWIREASYREVPQCSFKYHLIVQLTTSTGGLLTWSTYPPYNANNAATTRIPTVSAYEEDNNGDNHKDLLNVQIQFPLDSSGNEPIVGVQMMAVFSYNFYQMVSFSMESLGLVDFFSPVPGSSLNIQGDLALRQRNLLKYSGTDNSQLTSLISVTSTDPDEFDYSQILGRYFRRNVTTVYTNTYATWTPSSLSETFVINATFNYITPTISYMPGFWYVIKWGWIQYLAVAFIVYFVLDKIKQSIFEHQVVRTIVQRPPCACITQKVY